MFKNAGAQRFEIRNLVGERARLVLREPARASVATLVVEHDRALISQLPQNVSAYLLLGRRLRPGRTRETQADRRPAPGRGRPLPPTGGEAAEQVTEHAHRPVGALADPVGLAVVSTPADEAAVARPHGIR